MLARLTRRPAPSLGGCLRCCSCSGDLDARARKPSSICAGIRKRKQLLPFRRDVVFSCARGFSQSLRTYWDHGCHSQLRTLVDFILNEYSFMSCIFCPHMTYIEQNKPQIWSKCGILFFMLCYTEAQSPKGNKHWKQNGWRGKKILCKKVSSSSLQGESKLLPRAEN